MSRKRQRIITVEHEDIDPSKPHTYLVRLMMLGFTIDRLKTSDLETARTIYRKWYPPTKGGTSPSLRVDGQTLTYDSEMILMFGELGGSKNRKLQKAGGSKAKPPFARTKNVTGKGGLSIYLNKTASYLMLGIGWVRIDVDQEHRVISLIDDTSGLRLVNLSHGREVCAVNALRGVDIAVGVRYPVEACDGGLRFRY